MKIRLLLPTLAASLMSLQGCHGSPPVAVETEASAIPTVAARPTLVPAGIDIVPALQAVGAPWDTPVLDDRGDYTGGSINLYRRSVTFAKGSIQIDRTEDGAIHYVAVHAGFGDRCGEPAALGKAYFALSQALGLPPLDKADGARLNKAWLDPKGWEELTIGKAHIKAIGGCVSALTFKAV